MSNQFRYLLTSEQMVATLRRVHTEEEVMMRVAVGDWDRIGALQHALLRGLGVGPGTRLLEAGCGPGRLAAQLARHEGLQYLGVDIVPQLLDYARRKVARADFRFVHVDRIALPAADGTVDIVVCLGLFPHILPEESYVYLEEARRVLRPGGRVVFSFHDYASPQGWAAFERSLSWVRNRSLAGTLNVQHHPEDLRVWAERLGFGVEALHEPQARFIQVDGPEGERGTLARGLHAYGQWIGIFSKPMTDAEQQEGEKELAAARRRAARARRERATDAAEADDDRD